MFCDELWLGLLSVMFLEILSTILHKNLKKVTEYPGLTLKNMLENFHAFSST